MSHLYPVLLSLAEPSYREFSRSLLPGVDSLLGVRLPTLRKLAARLVKEQAWREFLNEPALCFEETLLQGMVLGLAKAPAEEILRLTAEFLPRIDNWSVCDSTCAGYRPAKEHPDEVFPFALGLLNSPEEFTVRFGTVLLLDHFVTKDRIDRVLEGYLQVTHPGYYAVMGVAWAISVCYVKFPEKTLPLLEKRAFPPETHRRAIQKILESKRVGKEEKERIKVLK